MERTYSGGMRPDVALVGLGLAIVCSDGVVRWNDKGRAIADTAGVQGNTLLMLEAEAMSGAVADDLAEVGLWQRNAR